MPYAVGSLVRARGREWVVLPGSKENLLLLRPLGGTEDEETGIITSLEAVDPAKFDLPDPSQLGDHNSSRLLRDAVRLGFRSSAGPFRSFGRIAFEPRPYQVVPLIMALRLHPVRMLIADDVGIGKTIEACLIARELIDRGEEDRLAVLCPPHLAEQWQQELREKFHIEAELVLPSTAARLERHCRLGQSLFEFYPFVVVSMDFIKSERRRYEFMNSCPRLVIVDEAHTCAFARQQRGSRHQRHQLVKGLAEDPDRHLILVTATPHSGNEEEFRSLLTLLDPSFTDLPQDLRGAQNEHHRRRLAAHFVQRRRPDLLKYMDTDTPFPVREDKEATYRLGDDYRRLFERVLKYARDTVESTAGGQQHQRVRWWSALALLRALASSPAAAAATLRNRSAVADADTLTDIDNIGCSMVLDQDTDEAGESPDVIPGSDAGEKSVDEQRDRRLLLDLARQADALRGDRDTKLITAVKHIRELLKAKYRPIVFCRFIDTADYLAEELRARLGSGVEVVSVTGTLPPSEREERIIELSCHPQRVLVATDCLSEGINLQDHFDAVVHYDLSWNPTRHEQREGRVDRFGQTSKKVRVLTYYGVDNRIDGIVLDVLLRKHKIIRSSLGISVPVPVDSSRVMEAILEGLLLRGRGTAAGEQLVLFSEQLEATKRRIFTEWENVAERERLSRTLFAQASVRVEEVAREMKEAWAAVGAGVDVERFARDGFRLYNGLVTGEKKVHFDLKEAPQSLVEAVGNRAQFTAQFTMPVPEGVVCLHRTHPVIEGLANHILNGALDPLLGSPARRCGVIRTGQVGRRTTLLLVRLRYHLLTRWEGAEKPLLAEDLITLAFAGPAHSAEWLDSLAVEPLLAAVPEGNIAPEQARSFVRGVIDNFDKLLPHLEDAARRRATELLAAHSRVRSAARLKGVRYRVEPQLPPDIIGIYIYLPKL